MPSKWSLAPLLACALAVSAPSAQAAIRSFLLIPGVPGESTDDRHARWIDLQAFSVGVSDGVCTGFTVNKNIDASSPLLSGAALNGAPYASMTVDVTLVSERNPSFLTYTLSNVAVTSVQVGASSSLSEVVTLRPGAITMTYRPLLADGKPGNPVSFSLSCPKK